MGVKAESEGNSHSFHHVLFWLVFLESHILLLLTEYRFAQFNTTSGIYSYSNDEYNAHLRGEFCRWIYLPFYLGSSSLSLSFLLSVDDDWTQAETDYLMDLCTSYDLRFVVIHDRYDWPGGKPRSIEVSKGIHWSITFSQSLTPLNFLSSLLTGSQISILCNLS